LIEGKGQDWRDIEALAALNTNRSRKVISEALTSGDPQVTMAVISYAPDTVPTHDRIAAIVCSLRNAVFYAGLSQALDLVEEFHPPEVVEELFRGVQQREGEVAVHFAAMLLFIYGKAEGPFDRSLRPFFLRFNTEDKQERRKVFLDLCKMIGVRPVDHEIEDA
jgi:hypothetical protein